MIGLLSLRYTFSSTSHHRSSSIRILLSTAFSFTLLVIIIASMNYLQNTRFDNIRNVRSFDCVVSGQHKDEISQIYPDKTIFEYASGEALVSDRAFLVRYIDSDYDGGLRFLTGDSSSLIIPYSLYASNRSSTYSLSVMKKGKSGVVLPQTSEKRISGVYATAMGNEFDAFYIFMPIEDAGDNAIYSTAIKGMNNKEIANLKALGYDVTSWKDAEASLYSAFLIEKTLMYVILALLFLLVGVSTKQSIRIFYQEKRKERAELEILGLERRKINLAFLLSFYIVLASGLVLSLVLTFILIPIIERLSLSFIGTMMTLVFPTPSFIIFALMLALSSFFFCTYERKKDWNMDLMEVVNGK